MWNNPSCVKFHRISKNITTVLLVSAFYFTSLLKMVTQQTEQHITLKHFHLVLLQQSACKTSKHWNVIKMQVLNCKCSTSKQVVSCKCYEASQDGSIILRHNFQILNVIPALRCSSHLNGELRCFLRQRLQGTEVSQEGGHPHTIPQISSAVCRSTERLNFHSLCGQQSSH